MRKNIIAIVLVFALAFGFASCKQLEKTDMFTIESQVYIVDDEGVTRNVQTRIKENGEVEYFYIDSDGNTIFVKKDDVVIETKRVLASTTDSNTFSPEAQSFLDAFNDPSSLDELIDTKDEAQSEPEKIVNVNDLLDELIAQSVALVGKPVALMNKEDKMRAIGFLSQNGAFLVTKSGDKIAKYFGISKYTLYSYIDKQQEEK